MSSGADAFTHVCNVRPGDIIDRTGLIVAITISSTLLHITVIDARQMYLPRAVRRYETVLVNRLPQ